MRFETLTFERYGAFTDRALTLRPDAQLHVVLGANEAGKTSALCAIGDLLFGFGKRTDYDFLHEGKTLRIGARLRLSDGSRLFFRRRKGDKNTLLDEADKPLSDDLLAFLLGAVTRETFFSEFGLTSRALREGGHELLKAGGRLAETLAAASARLSALSRLRARLEDEADALFGSRRSAGKAFYVATDRFEEAETKLRNAIVTADAFKAAEDLVAEARRKRDNLHAEHDKVGRDLARGQRALRTRPRLIRLDALRGELETHRDLPPISAETVASWRAALDEQKRVDEELAEYDLADAEGNSAIAALAVNEALLDAGPSADALREKLGAVRKAEEDLPKRREAVRIAREALTEAARRLGFASHEELLARMPNDPALASVRELIGERKTAERRLADAASELATARQELQELEEAATLERHAADPSPFLLRLEAFTDVPADADRLRREAAAHELEAQRLREETTKLDPPAGTQDELACRPLPEGEQIEAARLAFAAIDEEEKRAVGDLEAAKDSLATIGKDIARLSKAGVVATRDDLTTARMERDDKCVTLGACLDGDATRRRDSFEALCAANENVDETTDLLLSDADRASRLEAARERLAQERERFESLTLLRGEGEIRRREANAAWLTLWARSGVIPHAPAIMVRWFERVADILERRRRLDDKKIETDALSRKLEARRSALTRLVEDMGAVADVNLPIEALYKNARAAVDRLQSNWTAARERVVLRKRAAEAVTRLETTCARLGEDVERVRSSWPKAIAAIGFSGDPSIAEAEAALAVWRDIPMQKQKFEDENHRIRKMQDDIADFEREVAKLVETAALDLADRPARDALDQITVRLAAARRARDQRETLLEAAKKRAATRAALATKRVRTSETLQKAREALRLSKDVPLESTIERLERQGALTGEIVRIQHDLTDIGDGLDEQTLRGEQGDLDFDILPSEIERLLLTQKQLVADIAEATTALHDAGKARDALAAGRDADSAARDKAEANAELITITERWLARSAAARLAARAIERHRAAVQDPLVARASALFAVATAGAFAGLGADYDEADTPVLVGLRPDGVRVPVFGMSEGTRDQLYLSLRLALLELRMAEPLPFIADDLLASFDEKRVAQALELLAEFGRTRQTILFTHHRHVADIAREKLSTAADVVSL